VSRTQTANAPRFPLGRIVATPGALRTLNEAAESPLPLLRRHAHGDWGDLHPDDNLANERALRTGMRLLSAYVLPTEERIWIITEADRSVTTVLTPEEY
jgi:hypothetical protein